jgi:hypothetical protein
VRFSDPMVDWGGKRAAGGQTELVGCDLAIQFLEVRMFLSRSGIHQSIGVVTQLLSIFSQPCCCVLNDGDQIQPDQEMRLTSAWTVAQSVCVLLHGVRAFTSASQVHEFLILRCHSGNRWIQPWVITGLDVDHRAMFGFWLTQDTQGTFIYMVDVDISLVFPVGRPFHRTGIVDAMSFGVKAHASHEHSTRADRNTFFIDSFGCSIG